ncbi:hypothetical protein [Bacillus sp. S/N-304-OC-R1]|uniref:hypothetical protein n=1 Tax=Bacillus sp. S/N-304-OC-R1 TaxID=2758034 RepID=UPI001C8E62FC|nr:hypothetical protein [Bacillus sp. S/N-304-OC-R1]MBY0120991.1 hypothetical protein [Bacillus sp. S/N-304-OC-R1]
MGYIAPINHYDYSQYAEREIIKKYDPYRFVPIKPIKTAAYPPECQSLKSPESIQNFKKASKKNQHVHRSKVDKLYGEITGKGLLYSDYA